jgi:UDP-N-acetyl-D-galactosamine dehydrogenase
VLEAAGTKWNFLKFSPGLVGGHCIGVDPYYLTYKADSVGYHARIINSGRAVNDSMGAYIAKETIKKITNAKILSLKELALQFNIDIANCSNKNQILEKIQEHIEKHFWEPVNINKADNVDLISLGRTMKKELDTLFELEIPDIILIENQISPIANRMKTLQGMIAQYFIDRNANKIIFVSASNKLKHFNEEVKVKTTYSDRKQKSIEITKKEILNLDNNSNNETKWYEYFNKHKKNDDLADSYLQALWFMNHSYLDIE